MTQLHVVRSFNIFILNRLVAFYSVVYLAILLANIHFIRQTKKKVCIALAALHLPLWVTHSVTVTLEFVHKEWLF